MPLSLARSQEISAGFIQRQNRRRQTRPTNATPSQLRSLQSWLVVFWMNQHLQSRISRYLRSRGGQRGSRREAMQRYLIGRNQEMDKYENVELQVSPPGLLSRIYTSDVQSRIWPDNTSRIQFCFSPDGPSMRTSDSS